MFAALALTPWSGSRVAVSGTLSCARGALACLFVGGGILGWHVLLRLHRLLWCWSLRREVAGCLGSGLRLLPRSSSLHSEVSFFFIPFNCCWFIVQIGLWYLLMPGCGLYVWGGVCVLEWVPLPVCMFVASMWQFSVLCPLSFSLFLTCGHSGW